MISTQREVKVEPKYCESKGCGKLFFPEVGTGARDCPNCAGRGYNKLLTRVESRRKLPARVVAIDQFKHVM
ncbi:hypothetical protein GOB94_13990 [Granulicella sp. 5B5]|uniref:hypothetical protein n=1 Tax=Granulicella sp. 5B5 TaxID=1617967 RepID=UPI0015F5EF3B|nr:hypothetical protein [Granulicella sp. 5B5]QMV19676.1 hypothetical protein GOB94_13990 [Granulicella sp. 5B5]